MPSSARSTGSHRPPGQRQRKEKQFNATTTPTTWAPSATGRQYRPRRRPKRARRPAQIDACTDPPTPVAQRATAPERVQSDFFSSTGRGAFSFCQEQKRMGAHPAGQAPLAGASIPVAAGAAHSRSADAYGSSRHSGMDMHRGPPRPRESSALGMVWSRMPASSRARLVT